MKNIHRFKAITFFLLAAYLLSACAGAPVAAPSTSSSGSDKVVARPVTYVGVVENIVGDQWTINGVTVTVVSNVVQDGPFAVGDQVKVEGLVNADGSITVSRVEAPSSDDLLILPSLGNENDSTANDNSSLNDNGNDANTNDENGNESNSNDDNSNDDDANSNDDNSNDDNGNDSNSNDDDSNDDNGNDSNSNDDNGNDSNSNDDSGDDHGGSNSNDDDDRSGSNSNDDDEDDDKDDNSND